MISRVESAAATRRALVRAALDLLDAGGPNAVTLRAVGARAGVSRGAPYGHFAGKDDLLTALAIDAWIAVGEGLARLRSGETVPPARRLRAALLMVLELARTRPHRYTLMFTVPEAPPEPLVRAVAAAQTEFLAIVAETVDVDDPRHIGALLMSTAHGVAGMELTGQLTSEKWNATGESLIETIIAQVTK